MVSRKALLAAIASITLAASAQAAVLITSFESGPGLSGGQGVVSPNYATDGVQSLKLTTAPSWWTDYGFINGASGADFKAHTTLLIDFAVPAQPGNADWQNETMLVVWMQGAGLGWTALPDVTLHPKTTSLATGTVSINYFSLMASVPQNPGWWQVGFVIKDGNSTVPMDVYLDNVRVVPEPTLAVGMAAASLGLMLRKRQK